MQQKKEIAGGILDPAKIGPGDPQLIEVDGSTEGLLICEINEMINNGEIIQIKDRFRMPYSNNKNTISSCSNIMNQNERRNSRNVQRLSH